VAEFAKSADFLGVHLVLNTPISTTLDLDEDSVPGLLGGEKDFLSERKASIRLLLLNVRSGKDSRQVGGTSGNVCDGTHAKCTGC
jgi:hypothetical protein